MDLRAVSYASPITRGNRDCRYATGQTVFHVHVHLIPRRDGDVADPRGGVRGVIPSKQRY
ncbi:HIT domain-containing protein [Nereida sp.]|uniref:HIT domain-containing protein n=1 Tax=Nereida sp. TaxID=2736090 RepID=UPI003F6A16D8